MKKNSIYLIASIIILISCAEAQQNNVQQLNAIQFDELTKKEKGIIIDVRTQREYERGHIDNSLNLNIYSREFKNGLKDFLKDEPVYIYCLSGSRSNKAAKILADMGFEEVYNLQRGLIDWNRNNLPLRVGSQLPATNTENEMGFEKFDNITKANEIVFLNVYAPWCAPCKKMKPQIEELEKEYAGKISFVKVNADENSTFLKQMDIASVPHIALYNRGKQVYAKNSYASKSELINAFAEHLEGKH